MSVAVVLGAWLVVGVVSASIMSWAAWHAPLDVELWPEREPVDHPRMTA